ncbi:aldehyde dehydrogenase family protein [Luethyella okanaganae]|uniref:Aldehyde dehydrogenase family protein n=1 Tax=Luethyella okanaganae TaxID=69372 RepID=A0ABW1V9C3_9MICO
MTTFEGLLSAIEPAGGEGRAIRNPATNGVVGRAPVHTVEDLERAVAAAVTAQPQWEALGHAGRVEIMLRAADRIDEAAEALAQIITREQGKPLNGPGARFEAGGCAAWLRASATTTLEPEVVVDDEQTRAELHYRAIGVVGAIGPWNWPALIAIWQIAPALRMGNAVVVKPSAYTPLSVLAVVAILNQELPEGVLTVMSGNREVVARIVEHPAIGKIMFTGSTETGKTTIKNSADNITRLTPELGGNDPGIVLPDVDPKAIAEGLFWGAFINTGQTRAALKRLYVHEDVYEEVCQSLREYAVTVRMGDGADESSVLGPLTNRPQWEIVDDLVEKAKASGARVLLGGNPDRDRSGNFYPTTLVAEIDPDDPLVLEEQFGPALPIVKYSDLEDVIRRANALESGLGASVWSGDVERARAIAPRIKAGTVWINSHGGVHPMIPFGGIKESGYGLEFGAEGLKGLGVPQIING